MEQLAAKGPALANGAFLVAEDCPWCYVAVFRVLFAANQFYCLDMDIMFDLLLDLVLKSPFL